MLAPLAIPLLPPETYIRYTHEFTPCSSQRIENHQLGPLPQFFADQFGWEEMAATVAGVYNSLPGGYPQADRDLRPKLRAGRARSICSGRNMDCRRRSAGIKAIFCGVRAATPAKA